MPPPNSPTVRRRLLAAELRRLRLDMAKTAEEVGAALNWSKAKISRYELAQSALRPGEVARLLDAYGVSGGRRERLLALADDATQKGWWQAFDDVLTEGHKAFIGLEAEATSILDWQINVVPGLLQTEQYARDVLSAIHVVAPITPKTIERRLEMRLYRQHLLTREDPPKYHALLDESVLRRQHGDRAVMRAQLLRLLQMAELPNVTIQVLPFQRTQALAVDSFSILQFGVAHEAELPDVVSLEHLIDELHIEGDSAAHTFRLAFSHLAAECLSPSASRELIKVTSRTEWGDA
jgi:hypothetical protein